MKDGWEVLKSDIEADVKEKAVAILARRGMTIASFLRTKVYDLVEQHEAVAAGRTQFDSRCMDCGGDAA